VCAPTRAAAGYSAMMHSSIRNLALAFVVLGAVTPTLAGCAPYKVVQQSGPPSALQGVQQVAVSFDWSQVQVAGKPEAAYLAEKSAEEQQDFQTIKQETDAAVLEGMKDKGGPGVTFTVGAAADPAAPSVVVQYMAVTTGIYTHVFNVPTKVQTRFQWSRDGKVTDIIETRAMVSAGITTPSDHQRMGMAGGMIGKAAGRFLVASQAKK
jgi:hypothetical protein